MGRFFFNFTSSFNPHYWDKTINLTNNTTNPETGSDQSDLFVGIDY